MTFSSQNWKPDEPDERLQAPHSFYFFFLLSDPLHTGGCYGDWKINIATNTNLIELKLYMHIVEWVMQNLVKLHSTCYHMVV
jgi:hypothetical protein